MIDGSRPHEAGAFVLKAELLAAFEAATVMPDFDLGHQEPEDGDEDA